jgi:hypothetical protein
MRRSLNRLFVQLGGRAPVALFRRGFGAGETALGDEIACRKGIAGHATRQQARL